MHINNILNTHSLCISVRKKIKLVNIIWNWILSESKLDSQNKCVNSRGSARRVGGEIVADDMGRYSCIFANSAGNDSSSVRLRCVGRLCNDALTLCHLGLSILRLWLSLSVTGRLQLMWAEVWQWNVGSDPIPNQTSPGPGMPQAPGTEPSPPWAASWPRETQRSPT